MTTLADWLGTHSGIWKTYLRPGELHDQSQLKAEITEDDTSIGVITISYRGAVAGDDVVGSMVVEPTIDGIDIVWTDSWHTAGKSERLAGSGDEDPWYGYGPDDEPWRWSIDVRATDAALTITHHNTTPTGESAVAVEMVFTR